MPPLVAALRFPDVMCQRYAAMGIGNFSSNDTNRCAIVTEGTVPPLISLACSEDQEDKLVLLAHYLEMLQILHLESRLYKMVAWSHLVLAAHIENVEVHQETCKC